MESHRQCETPLKVAIIGSGLAGLTTAFLLTSGNADAKQKIQVELLERSATLGMDSEAPNRRAYACFLARYVVKLICEVFIQSL